jgi:hypothetical protein
MRGMKEVIIILSLGALAVLAVLWQMFRNSKGYGRKAGGCCSQLKTCDHADDCGSDCANTSEADN